MQREIPIPDYMPTRTPSGGLEDLALEVYQRLADAGKRVADVERKAQEELAASARESRRLIARLASERFEFARLMSRLQPELMRNPALAEVLDLFARSWDESLKRVRIEVIDLAGQPLAGELENNVDVQASVPDPAVTETIVRETLVPLVKHEGRVIGLAKVVTSAPVANENSTEDQEVAS